MDTPTTLALVIRCSSCEGSFRLRGKAPQRPWRQRSARQMSGELIIAYLCDSCAERFSGEDAALDFLEGILEQRAATG